MLAEMSGIACTLGMAVFTSTRFAFWWLDLPPTIAGALAFVAALLVVAVILRQVLLRRSAPVEPLRGALRVLPVMALMVGAGVTAFAVWTAMHPPIFAWDAWAQWALKGKMFAAGGPPRGFFQNPDEMYVHLQYPLNVPIAESPFYALQDPLGSDLAALVGPALLGSLLFLFYAGLARLHGHIFASLGVVALASVPALVLNATNGNADAPLGVYLGAASLYLLLWWRFRSRIDAVLMGLFAGGALWTKQEGMYVAAAVLALYVLPELRGRDVPRRQRLRTIVPGIGSAIALPLPWLLFTKINPPLAQTEWTTNVSTLAANLSRIPNVMHYFGTQMLTFDSWSFLWVWLAAALLLSLLRPSVSVGGLCVLLAGQLGIYVMSYVAWSGADYVSEINVTMDRLLVQAVPLAVLLLLEALATLSPSAAGRRHTAGSVGDTPGMRRRVPAAMPRTADRSRGPAPVE